MVEYELTQIVQMVSQIATAIGVCIAATYYVITLRTAEKNRRIQLLSSTANYLVEINGMKDHFELLNMNWKDYDDFEKKYYSDNNVDTDSKMYVMWGKFEFLGYMLRNKMIDAYDLWSLLGLASLYQWTKWESIIKEHRKRYNGESFLTNFEFLATEMWKIQRSIDPTYKIPETFGTYIPDQ
ncbi:hypothetical protein FJY84_00125 [Candidatus Bathyarchaeota archaeon]|nr:hypothetical protein [Candidatus Bathyarchaeota archaeon]